MLFGVAAGMAEYFHVDVALVRLAWVLMAFSGIGVPAYIIATLVIPSEPDDVDEPAPADAEGAAEDRSRTLGWALLIIGAAFFLERVTPRIEWGRVWPLLLIGLGLYLIAGRRRV